MDFVDLMRGLGRQVAEAPARVPEQEEADDLEDPLAGPGVGVADVAELFDKPAMRAGFLVYLSQRGLARVFAGPDVPLRQRPEAWFLARRPDCGEHPPAFQPPHQDASGRELSFHADESIPGADRLRWISGRAGKAATPGSRHRERCLGLQRRFVTQG